MHENPNLALATRIAPHLGSEWTARPDQNWATLTRLDGLSLSLHTDAGRAIISAAQQETVTGYRYYDSHRTPRPQITCAQRRGPGAIAQDIRRRLLPDVEAHYPEECAYIQHSNARHRLQQQTRHVLATAGQGHVIPDSDNLITSTTSYGLRPSWRAEVSANPEYGIRVEIHYLDLETAAQVLEILATAPASNSKKP